MPFARFLRARKYLRTQTVLIKKLELKTSAFSSNTLMFSATISVSAVSEVKSKDKALRHCKFDPDTSFHSSLGLYECTHRQSDRWKIRTWQVLVKRLVMLCCIFIFTGPDRVTVLQ